MKTTTKLLTIAVLVTSACARTVHVESGGEVAASQVTPVTSSVLPAGATINVELDQSLSARNHAGDKFTAHVTDNLMAQDGSVAVPSGAVVTGRVTGIEAPSDPTRPALVRVDFETLAFDGRSYPFNGSVERTMVKHANENILKSAGVGGAAGAILGAVIGRDVEGIVVGGAIGAAAGSLISLGVDAAEARLPEGSRMTLRNTDRVALWR